MRSSATTWSARPADRLARPRLLRTPYAAAQPRLFGLDETGWLKALRLGEYAAREPRRPATLQEALFACLDALYSELQKY